MIGVTVTDHDDNKCLVPLGDVLNCLGPRARASMWRLGGMDVYDGSWAEELNKLSEKHISVSGDKLFTLIDNILQVIEGRMFAFFNHSTHPWLALFVIDSSAYDVLTDDQEVIHALKVRFATVRDLPIDAYPTDLLQLL